MTTASAPGKLMLFGEHAVVYNNPCLVTAVDIRVYTTIEPIENLRVQIDASTARTHGSTHSVAFDKIIQTDTVFPRDIQFVAAAVRRVFNTYQLQRGLTITTHGPEKSYGLGSSSAATVATVAALGALFNLPLSKHNMFDLAYQAVLDVQGTGSGFDIAAAVYGGTLYFRTGGEVIEPLEVSHLPIIIGYSGNKVGTVSLVKQVAALKEMFPWIVDSLFEVIEKLTDAAKIALLAGDWQQFGQLMDINQGLLESLGVNTLPLSELIYTARRAGAWGAKLSGAGGGDCMFAIAPDNKYEQVKDGMQATCNHINLSRGGHFDSQIVNLDLNTMGVRVEE